ncbi:MAG: hypothetical protein EXS08_07335 [Planctomycetes bacterium]|nr:hypothetical protein [Planctomycetota bacterium]
MIAALFLSLLPNPASSYVLAPRFVQEADAETDAKIAAAGTDVAKLLALAKELSTGGKDDAAKKVYKKIVELDPKHEEAHKALRHHFYDNKWFESYAELSKYRREETSKMKEKGLVHYKDEWIPEGDLPYRNMGWAKDEAGKWANPIEAARNKQIEEWKGKGYEFQKDMCLWYSAEDKQKGSSGLIKCGEEWFDLAKANEFHAQIQQPWQMEGDHFTVWTTCDWQTGNDARWYADKTFTDLSRLFGMAPSKKPHFVVLNSLDQYNQAAGGTPPLMPETEGISSLHGAYFADAFFTGDPAANQFEYLGCGVTCWDKKDDKLKAWGPFWLRWAAAQSYCEALDPSWLAISENIAAGAGGGGGGQNTFWTEKKIPRWMRYGAASYSERFLKDPGVQSGGNPWALRDFAFAELKKGGALHKVEDVFAFTLSLDDIEGSSRLYHEAGLVVSFLLDGADGDKKLRDKHAAFKLALKNALSAEKPKDADKKLIEAVEDLQKELGKNEKDIKKFAGL